MANEAKYRPSLTLSQIDALVSAAGQVLDSCENVMGYEDLIEAAKVLRVFQFKANMGVTAPAHVPTGGKPGPVSAADLVTAKEPELTYEEAKLKANFYIQLNQPVPLYIQKVLTKGEGDSENDHS